MEKINITFLGTSNAIPTEKRSHTSIFLNYKSENILIDCGEGTQRQLKIAGISPSKINHILITHWHGDHILGLPGLFQTLAMSDYRKTLNIYGPRKTKYFISLIEKLITRFKIKIKVHEISNTKKPLIETSEFLVQAMSMQHKVPALAYSFKIKDKYRLSKAKLKKFKLPHSPILKKLQQGKSIKYKGKTISPAMVSKMERGRKITFILDTKFNNNAIKLAKESDLIISESAFSSKENSLASEKEHLTAQQAATIAKRSGSKALILTHISQRYEKNPQVILEEAKKTFKNTKLANDFDKISV